MPQTSPYNLNTDTDYWFAVDRRVNKAYWGTNADAVASRVPDTQGVKNLHADEMEAQLETWHGIGVKAYRVDK
jgi:hypothetical protein